MFLDKTYSNLSAAYSMTVAAIIQGCEREFRWGYPCKRILIMSPPLHLPSILPIIQFARSLKPEGIPEIPKLSERPFTASVIIILVQYQLHKITYRRMGWSNIGGSSFSLVSSFENRCRWHAN